MNTEDTRRACASGSLGTGGVSETRETVVEFDTVLDMGVGRWDFAVDVGGDIIRDAGRAGVCGVACVGVCRPLRGIRLGVTTTDGILLGGVPRTLAIGEAFHLGRAWIGMRPPVPVPWAVLGRGTKGAIPTGTLDRGVKNGSWRRLFLVVVDVLDTDRFRWVSGVR